MRLLVAGTGPAGITVAARVRQRLPDATITVLTTEPYPPYSPPAMADYFLRGRESTLFWQGAEVCARLGVEERRHVRAVRVDTGEHLVELAGGAALEYDALVIATGSRLDAPIPGADLPGVLDFKSLLAASRIVDAVRSGTARTAVITGCGFIGVEIALLLADLGVRPTILCRRTWVMPRMLDRESAAIAEAVMRRRGVDVQLGDEAVEFLGDTAVRGLRMASGRVRTADLYIAATGVRPNVEMLDGSGIVHEWGIQVDDRLRTSAPDVWACGDVAEAADRITGQRYVHAIFPNAVAQAEVVARNLCGDDVAYPGAESMNSLKHLGLPIIATGAMEGEETFRFRDGDVLRKVFVTDGRITGFRLTGDVRAAGVLRTMLLRGDDVGGRGPELVDPRLGTAGIVFRSIMAA